ncbi:MAG: hypothetical protein K2Y27_05200 [Xanthobacteraceae bacterium]|nr:hypothetical protein [Xanthobacteraceae bacterium]
MRKLTILSLGIATLGGAFGLASAGAQDAPGAPKPPAAAQHGMMGGDMHGMMGMMERMNRMMDQCERMMQAREKKDESGKGSPG